MRCARSLFVAAALVLGLVACKGDEPEGEKVESRAVLFSLLDRADLMQVLPPTQPAVVNVQQTRPRSSGPGDFGAHPALQLPPPTSVRFTIPKVPAEARLRFGVGITMRHYRGEGGVTFDVQGDGASLFSRTLSSAKATPGEDRKWTFAEIPISEGELVLSTEYDGDQDVAPRASFALLEIVVPIELTRRKASPEKPNVVMIVIDTQRADALSTYSSSGASTPSIDRLANEGTVFENGYSAAPWTSPSTASLLTTLSPPAHGYHFHSVRHSSGGGTHLLDGLTTLPEVLQLSGWHTAGFSSNPLVSIATNFDQGFDHFEDFRWRRVEGGIMDGAMAWLEENAGDRFFLYLHLVDPHDPYDPVEGVELEDARPEGFEGHSAVLLMKGVKRNEEHDADHLRAVADFTRALYDAEVEAMDTAIGELVRRIDELGLTDRTIFAITSDHGEEFLEHRLIGHTSQVYPESLHVPLILKGPGVARGERIETPVENRFLASTILRLVDVGPRDNLAPVDLFERGAEPLFFTTRNGFVFRRHGNFGKVENIHACLDDGRFFLWAPEANGIPEHFELYDLRVDPTAQEDLGPGTAVKEIDARKALIQAWLDEGAKARPQLQISGETDLQMLRDLGYLGDDD